MGLVHLCAALRACALANMLPSCSARAFETSGISTAAWCPGCATANYSLQADAALPDPCIVQLTEGFDRCILPRIAMKMYRRRESQPHRAYRRPTDCLHSFRWPLPEQNPLKGMFVSRAGACQVAVGRPGRPAGEAVPCIRPAVGRHGAGLGLRDGDPQAAAAPVGLLLSL